MVLWFAIVAPVLVAEIFRSPMVDYRLVAVGALLPLIEVAAGAPNVLHTLVGAVATLFAVMGLTVNRRLVRRRLLGIPIGLFFHLLLDGTWLTSDLFWWPAFGTAFEAGWLPEADRSPIVVIGLELLAIAVGVWAWRRYGLDRADNRDLLLRQGHLARTVLR